MKFRMLSFWLILNLTLAFGGDVKMERIFAQSLEPVTVELSDGRTFKKSLPNPVTYSFFVAQKAPREITIKVSLDELLKRVRRSDRSSDRQTLKSISLLPASSNEVVFDEKKNPKFIVARHEEVFILYSVVKRHDLILQTHSKGGSSFCYIVKAEEFPELLDVTG